MFAFPYDRFVLEPMNDGRTIQWGAAGLPHLACVNSASTLLNIFLGEGIFLAVGTHLSCCPRSVFSRPPHLAPAVCGHHHGQQ